MVLIRKGSHQYALRKAFKCVSHEINKLLIKLLDFNNVKSNKITIFSVKVNTEFGIFSVRLINKDSTGGLNTRLHLEVPVKFFVQAYLFYLYKEFGLDYRDKETIYRTKAPSRHHQEARAALYHLVPLVILEELLTMFFKSGAIGNSTVIRKKIIFSVNDLFNQAVLKDKF